MQISNFYEHIGKHVILMQLDTPLNESFYRRLKTLHPHPHSMITNQAVEKFMGFSQQQKKNVFNVLLLAFYPANDLGY